MQPGRERVPVAGRWRRRLLALGLLLGLTPALAGTGARNVRFQRFSVEDGVPRFAVNAVVQDRHGLIWFATQEGLRRFDGYRVTRFKHDPEDPGSLPDNWVWTVLPDRKGGLWVGTNSKGLARFDPIDESFTSIVDDPAHTQDPAASRVRVIYEDRNGRLWIGTDGGLRSFDPATGEVTHRLRAGPAASGGIGDDRIRAIHEDRQGALWIGTDGGGLDRFDPQTGGIVRYASDPELPSSLGSNRVRSLHQDSDGVLWVGTYESGLDRFDPASQTFRHFRHDPADPASLAHNRVRAIFRDSEGRLWVGTDDGLSRYRQESDSFTTHRYDAGDPASLIDNRVLSLFEDRGGVLWIGTYGGLGNWNVRTGAFIHFRHDPLDPDSLSGNVVNAFAEAPDGTLWVGTYGTGLNRLDARRSRFDRFAHDPDDPRSLADNRVMSLQVDRRGRVWVGTLGNGLDRFESATRSFTHFRHDANDPSSLGADGVTTIFEDRDGVLWVGTYHGGLNRFDEASGTFVRYRQDPRDPHSLSDNRVLAIYQDRDGILWIGTEGGGLNRFDPRNATFTAYRHDPQDPTSLSSDTAWAIYEDERRVLWVATQAEGLNRWAPADRDAGRGVFRRLSEDDGLPGATIYGIVGDDQDNLWLSGNRGIARFDPDAGTFRLYDTSHGLQGHEFNFGAYLRRRNGEILFGGVGGFNAFYPERVRENPHRPPVVLTAVYKSNRLASFDTPLTDLRELVLTHHDYGVSFEFAALDFTAPHKNRYRYRLEGFEQEWVEIGTARRASYTTLPPGDYTFRVSASNNDGLWNEAGIGVRMKVLPPPWKTWWAYTLYGLMMLGSVLLYARIQRKKLQREAASREAAQAASRAKSEFLATVSHELRTPMNGVLGMTELLLKTGLTDRQQHMAHTAQSSAQGLLDIINDILDFSRIDTGRLDLEDVEFDPRELIETVHELHAPLAADKSLRFSLLVPETLPLSLRGDAGRLRQVLTNLVSNAVKFTARGEITMRVECLPGPIDRVTLRCEVRDTGVGIAAEERKRIFEAFSQADSSNTRRFGGTGLGLAISKRLVELMGGRLDVDSRLGAGSTFWFTCPLAVVRPAVDRDPLSPEDLAGLRVLVAAGDETERGLLQLALRSWKVDGTITRALDEAWSAIRDAAARQRPIELAIIDAELPGAGGLELAKRIKTDPGLPQLECVLLVSVDAGVNTEQPETVGACRCLVKPIRKPQLLQCITEAAGCIPRARGEQRQDAPRPQTRERRLLLVEDSPLNREVCLGMLEDAGYLVDVAENGKQGFELASSLRYEAILMDLQMPVMDGFEATRRIRDRQAEHGPDRVPIIAVTASGTLEDQQRCRSADMDDFLAKPFTQEQLLAKLDRWVSRETVG